MAEGGGGNAIPPQRLPLSRDNLLRVLTTLRVVQNVKKAIAWSFRAEPSFGFHQNSPVKNFRTAKIFSSLPHFCQQKFFRFQRKNSAKRPAPSTPESVQSRSVDTDRWVRRQRLFEPQKISDQQTASSHKPKSSKKTFSNGENGWLDLKSVI